MYLRHLVAWCAGGLLALRFSLPLFLPAVFVLLSVILLGAGIAKANQQVSLAQSISRTEYPLRCPWFVTQRFTAMILLALISFMLCSVQLSRQLAQQVQQLDLATTQGCIVSLVDVQNNLTRFEFEPVRKHAWQAKARYRVSWFNAEFQPKAGSCWQLTLRLKAPRGTLNQIGFDYERWLFARRITALASVKAGRSNRRLEQRHFNQPLLSLRTYIYEEIQRSTQAYRSGALLGALAVGMRQGLSVQDWEILKRSGLAHLMAISGLHVGLAAGLGYGLMRWLPPWFSISWLVLWLRRLVGTEVKRPHMTCSLHQRGLLGGLLFGVIYAALAGFAIATVRALIMLALWTWWRWHRRRVDVFFVAAVTISLLLMGAPHTLAGNSFWMSCGAVLMLGWIAKTLPTANRWRVRVNHAVRLQWGVLILMLPLTSAVSGGFSFLALPLNLLLIPLFGLLLVPLVLFALAGMALDMPWTADVWQGLAWSLDRLWQWLERLTASEAAFVVLPTWSPWLLVPALLAGAYSMQSAGWPARRWVLVGLLPLFLSTTTCSSACLNKGEFRLDVLDTGQALSVVIATKNQLIVYDTGDAWPGGDSAQRVLVPWIAHQRYAGINHLIVSHSDSDHAGGVTTLLRHYPPEYVWVGEHVTGVDTAKACRQGISWHSDGVRFSFLYPPSAVTAQGNQQSCVLHVQGASGSVLLTGDLDRVGERRLIEDLQAAPVDLVVGAHHGSMTSSELAFVQAAAAQWVVFSNGADNQWGMPRAAVRTRWEQHGTRVLTTAESGQISFLSRRGEPLHVVRTARTSREGVWRQPHRP